MHLKMMRQEQLRVGDMEIFHICRGFINGLRDMVGNKDYSNNNNYDNYDKVDGPTNPPPSSFAAFVIVLDDTSGNSFVDNHPAPAQDSNLLPIKYIRMPNQEMALGFQPREEVLRDGIIDNDQLGHKNIMNYPWVGGGGLTIEEGVGEVGRGGGGGVGRIKEVL